MIKMRSGRRALDIVGMTLMMGATVALTGLLRPARLAAQVETALTPTALLARPVPVDLPNADQVRRGQHLVIMGDCVSCHYRYRGQPFAGGLGLGTPFGTIYTSNITPDPDTGIGKWTPDQFYRAMHYGVDNHGHKLYPAFPYPWFTKVSRADTDAIFAYLKTVPAVHYTPPANHLAFPFGFRPLIASWNLLYFKSGEFRPDPAKSAEWNQGAQIVNGLGHCSGCHSPRNALGAEQKSKAFHGGLLENFTVPDLTANDRTGIGTWSIEEIAEYLKTGRNAYAVAEGPMTEVINYSSSLMTDADRHAIAVYLKSLPASPTKATAQPKPAAMTHGAAIYTDSCSRCHLDGGIGHPGRIPPLGHNAIVQQANPAGALHIILEGGRIGTDAAAPTTQAMPGFAAKLNDREIADLATYLRNSWGNRASPVSAKQVQTQRHRMGLDTAH